MSFILRSITIYSHEGDRRTVEFRRSGLNILTGRSRTGKSSIIDILDYCFGRSECYVAAGIIRDHVSWFGVEVENAKDVLFIARRNPGHNRQTSSDIHIRRGEYDGPPQHSELHKNTTRDALIRLLTRFAGIAENESRPLRGSRGALQATVRHALFLCFQRQDEIASRDRLFHRQGEPFIPQDIVDTIPYFLGAVDEEHLYTTKELEDAVRILRDLEARRNANERDDSRTFAQVRRLVREARRVGLIDQEFEPLDVASGMEELRRGMAVDVRSPAVIARPSEVIRELERMSGTLRQQLEDVQNEIRATKHFMREQTAYSREVEEQRVRLTSLGLYTGRSDGDHVCPLCEETIETPTATASDLRQALHELDKQLDAVGAERPHLQRRLGALDKKRGEIEDALVVTQRDLERAYMDHERARSQRDQIIERSRVMGRIGAFLDQTDRSAEKEELDRQIERLRRRVDMLAERVGADDVEERVYTFLNLVAAYMTSYAGELELEHTEGRIRLDLKKLSVVAETRAGPIPLNKIGSGENWIGYHVVTLLALHRWFREQKRPVPGVLVFDQPTQAHFPPEADVTGRVDALRDADRRAVQKLFQFMNSASREIGGGFQLIVLDHAHLDEPWFESAVVETWRGGEALVPTEWYRGGATEPPA